MLWDLMLYAVRVTGETAASLLLIYNGTVELEKKKTICK